MLEELKTKKVHEVSAAVNLCSQELNVAEEMEMRINYSYKDSGRQLMILDIGAPVSLGGIS